MLTVASRRIQNHQQTAGETMSCPPELIGVEVTHAPYHSIGYDGVTLHHMVFRDSVCDPESHRRVEDVFAHDPVGAIHVLQTHHSNPIHVLSIHT
jgi:hypothetical protein